MTALCLRCCFCFSSLLLSFLLPAATLEWIMHFLANFRGLGFQLIQASFTDCQFRLLKFSWTYWGRVRGFPINFFQITDKNSVETNQSFLHVSLYISICRICFSPNWKHKLHSSFLKGTNMVSHQLTVVVINVKDPWGLLTSFLSFWWLRQHNLCAI